MQWFDLSKLPFETLQGRHVSDVFFKSFFLRPYCLLVPAFTSLVCPGKENKLSLFKGR
jgi:hypothetical protein